MRVRNVCVAIGLGAFVLLVLTPGAAQGPYNMPYYGPATSQAAPAYGRSWQPGYYGSPSYWPGTAYGPGQSYASPMYQPYAYQPSTAPCPPAQPISPSALMSAPP